MPATASPPAETAWSWSWDVKVFVGLQLSGPRLHRFPRDRVAELAHGGGLEAGGRRPCRRPWDAVVRAVHRSGARIAAGLPDRRNVSSRRRSSTTSIRTTCSWRSAPRTSARSSGARTFLGIDAVGSPALGPTVFMHRPSAAENPSSPLSHHMLDSTAHHAGRRHPRCRTEGCEARGIVVPRARARREPHRHRLRHARLLVAPRVVAARAVDRAGQRRSAHEAGMGRAVL